MTDNLPAIMAGKLSELINNSRMHIDDWADIGEDLALLDSITPWALGDWYVYGVKTYGAAPTIRRLQAFKRDFPSSFLARKSIKTLQNYASVCRAFPTSGSMRHYEFWHCDAVMGVPEDGRLYMLECGKNEEMSAARFRKFVAEEAGRQPGNGRSPAALAAENATLHQANGELHAAVSDYADRIAEIEAEGRAAAARLAAERPGDDLPPDEVAYRRDMPAEWVDDCPRVGFTCPACGAITTLRFLDLPDLETGAVIRCPECRGRVEMTLKKV